MKNLIYISILCIVAAIPSAFSQGKIGNLKGIYYQAVAIDEVGKEIVGTDISGKPVYKKAIGVKFTITKGLNGPIQWEETHTTTTDKYGTFTLIIGQGTQTGIGPYARMLDIPWIDADQFLKVELSTKNDGNFKLVSNQQFMSVPYSYYTDDIADSAITTYKIKDSAVQNQDVQTSAIDSRTILDSTILNRDIRTSAVDSRTLLDSTILNQDIKTSSIDSRTILDSTLINQDIKTSAVDSRTILDSTIINQDIKTGAVDSRIILDSAIQTQDFQTGSVNSRVILDKTILNEDIADSTIDLRTKVTGILPVSNGGIGTDTLITNSLLAGNGRGGIISIGQATEGQIAVGTDSVPRLKTLSGSGSIQIAITTDSVIISSRVNDIITLDSISPGVVDLGTSWVSDPIELPGASFGNILVGSIDADLKGCHMSVYVSAPNTIRVSIFNGTGNNLDLGEDRILRVLITKQ